MGVVEKQIWKQLRQRWQKENLLLELLIKSRKNQLLSSFYCRIKNVEYSETKKTFPISKLSDLKRVSDKDSKKNVQRYLLLTRPVSILKYFQ